MKKFKIRVVRETNLEIEVDENCIEELMKSYNSVIDSNADLKDAMEDLAYKICEFGEDSFHEGFGQIKIYGDTPRDTGQYIEKGINLSEIDELDADIEIEEII